MNSQQTHIDCFSWIELAGFLPSGRMLRGVFVNVNDQDAIARWRQRFNNTDIFASVFRYEKPDPTSRCVAPIFADIDCQENLLNARDSALMFCELLSLHMQTGVDDVAIYFSGSKGFHVLVPCVIFQPCPSSYTLALYKQIAQNARRQAVRFIDESVYTHRRLLRLPNSINSKSGLYKIPLWHKELLHLDLHNLLKLARRPRPDDCLDMPRFNPQAAQWYKDALISIARCKTKKTTKKTGEQFKYGWRIPPCIKTLQTMRLSDGTRHSTYLILARFYRWINMHPDEITETLLSIDDKNPIQQPGDIQRIVNWAVQHPGFPGCRNDHLKQVCCKEKCFYAQMKTNRLIHERKPK